MLEQARSEKLIGSNQELLNKLINEKLAPVVTEQTTPHQPMESLPLRKPQWGKIRAEYEAKKRHEYWLSKIAETEGKDAKS